MNVQFVDLHSTPLPIVCYGPADMVKDTMKTARIFATASLILLLSLANFANAQKWTPIKNKAPFSSPSTSLLLTDGSVIVQDGDASDWWRFTPDKNANYINGTWTQIASLPSGYGPLYYASAVLKDGRVIVEGGEYNLGSGQVETNLGAVYDPVANKWTSLTPPPGWANVGDAQSIVFPDGTFMVGDIFNTESAELDPTTMTWTVLPGTGKQDRNSEEGWDLLPDGTVLTTDALKAPNAEKFVISTGDWINAGNTIVRLEDPGSQEIGPAVLLPNNTVFATGANASGGGHTSIYTIPANPMDPGTWTVGPDIPNGLDVADAPAAVLPSGNVLIQASPGIYRQPSSFFEFDGTKFNSVPATKNAPADPSYAGRMLVLPTGQVFWTDGSTDVEIYTAKGAAKAAWAPTITAAPRSVTRGKTYQIAGTQFNGLTQGAYYGDDAQMATNYPLVAIRNRATGHIFFTRTHDHSTMGVATGTTTVSTSFDVPANMETGASDIAVVANGIHSKLRPITVQ